jgi:hypothetical protein
MDPAGRVPLCRHCRRCLEDWGKLVLYILAALLIVLIVLVVVLLKRQGLI